MIKGICRYCKQVILIDEAELDNETEEAIEDAAVRLCTCGGAEHHRLIQIKKAKALENISLAFHKANEDIEQIMSEAVPYVANRTIEKITIKGNKGIQGTMGMDSKGNIKIKVQYKKEAEYSE